MGEIIFDLNVFPLKEKPIKGIFVILFISFLAFLVFLLTSSQIFTICAFSFLFVDLSSFFFPTRYAIFKDKVDKKSLFGLQSFPVTRFKNIINCRNGILLSPYRNRSIMEKFRGLYIICYDEIQKEKILAFFKERINSDR